MNAFIYTRPLWEWEILLALFYRFTDKNLFFSVWGTYGQIFPVCSVLSVTAEFRSCWAQLQLEYSAFQEIRLQSLIVRYPEYKTRRISFCFEELCFLLFLISCPIHSFSLTLSPIPDCCPFSSQAQWREPGSGTTMRWLGQWQKAEFRRWTARRVWRRDLGTLSGRVGMVLEKQCSAGVDVCEGYQGTQ